MTITTTRNRAANPMAGRIVRIMLTALAFLLGVIVLFIIALLIISPGKPRSFLDDNGDPLAGSISEKIYVNINGVRQGMFIKSKDSDNPVLLYLHGGMPDYFLAERYPTGLEDIFTVVWWEQRGSGISYSPGIPPESLTLEQMIADTLEMTRFLQQRFGQEKIYLMGHSGGTFIGIQAAARAPELYHAYIGVAQMVNQLQSEILAYDYMLQEYTARGDNAMLRKLQAAPVTKESGVPDAYRVLRDPAMHALGIGTTHDMKSVISGVFLPSWLSRDYTLMEKVHTWSAKASSGIAMLWADMVTTDLGEEVTKFEVPVYFFSGVYDYTVNYSLSKEYFGKINAPVKGFYTFEQSAHSPMFEEPEKMQLILRMDVLAGENILADSK